MSHYEDEYEEFERERQRQRVIDRNAQRYGEHTRFADWTPQQRRNAADNFGENWANILSGLGDQ